MQSNGARAGIAAALIAAAVILFIVLSGSDDGNSNDSGGTTPATPTTTTSPTGAAGTTGPSGATDAGGGAPATPAVPTIVVKNGQPVGGIQELTYNKGDRVKFRVKSDVADEVHVHGYDLMKDVKAGGSVTFDFTADIDGIYEAELEGRKEQIIELRINP